MVKFKKILIALLIGVAVMLVANTVLATETDTIQNIEINIEVANNRNSDNY